MIIWTLLSKVIKEYIAHPETKSEGNTGLLKRRQITINKTSVSYIGKESNELDEAQATGVDNNNYTEYKNIDAKILKILSLTPKEARKQGISKTSYYRIIKKYREGEPLKLKK